MTEIRFLHAADLHLDTPFKGVSHFPDDSLQLLRNSTFQAFSNFIQYALKEKPDFIVIVGDIYDGADRSLRAQLQFQEGMEQLCKENIPVFLTYGNHDHLKGRWTRFQLPENVTVFPGYVDQCSIDIRGEKVTISGFSYPERHVTKEMIADYPIAEPGPGRFHIGLLHGSIEGDKSHAVYAPFTIEALLSKQYDYWALGHIHQGQSLHENPPIVYPGNLQGRHRKELGDKGFYDVTLSKEKVRRKFVSAAAIIFEKVTMSCKGIRHAGEWFQKCEKTLLKAQMIYNRPIIVDFTMVEIEEATARLFQESTKEEWLETLREWLGKHHPFIWVNALHYQYTSIAEHTIQTYIAPVLHTMEKWTVTEWEDVLQDLYQHARSIPYLDQLTDEDYERLASEVKGTLISALTELEGEGS